MVLRCSQPVRRSRSCERSLRLWISAPSEETVTVNYATARHTATAPGDYQDTRGVLTFAPGQTRQSFSVVVNQDAFDEAIETLILKLAGSRNAKRGRLSVATLSIVDDAASTV